MSRETYLDKLRKNNEPMYRDFKTCIVKACFNSSITTPNKIFVRVPKDSRRAKWFKAAGSNDIACIAFCCEDHFDLPNDMENWVKYTITGGNMYMKKHVIPYKLIGKNVTSSSISPPRQPSNSILIKRRETTGSILEKRKVVVEGPKSVERVQVKIKENMQLEETLVPQLECIKDEPLDIKEETVPTFELVQNYTNEYFLVPLSENNKQLENKLEIVKLNERCESAAIRNEIKKENIEEEPKGRKRKIYCPPDENKRIEFEELINSHNQGIKKSEEVACNEKYHKVDIFTIFGKSVADQLRSFPVDKAILLQNKIQDLITEERLNL